MKLKRDAMLLSKMKRFKSAVKKELKISESDDATYHFVGGVFCQSLALFHRIGLWKKKDATTVKLMPDCAAMNPEMIDWYCTGISRMNSYIQFRIKGRELTDDEQVTDAKLLQRIEPTVNDQLTRNETNKVRCISTEIDTIKKSYSGKELKTEFLSTKAKWDDFFEGEPLPYKPKRANKTEYALAVCKMREVFKRSDPEWERVTLQSMADAIEQNMAEVNNSIADRMNNASNSPFIHLCINYQNQNSNAIREAYSKKSFLLSGVQSTSTSNTSANDDNTTDIGSVFDL
jgi:hypothetical protein